MFVVEYSICQKAFHVDTLEATVEKNLKNVVRGYSNDYQIIALRETHEMALSFIESVRSLDT